MDWPAYLKQFLNVHLLLFGGATAYNSYYDKDKGAIGGLKNPPEMNDWMWLASWSVQILGLLIALSAGYLFTTIYLVSMVLFWLYSSPHFRWKGKPLKSMVAIGISTGTNSLLLGYLAASHTADFSLPVGLAAPGVMLILLSLYPISQLYQQDEDRRRGDRTYAVIYGSKGVFRFFIGAFSAGMVLLVAGVSLIHTWLAAGMALAGIGIGFRVWTQLREIESEHPENGYHRVMRIKYGTSLAFVSMLTVFLLIKHTSLGILLGLDMLLR